MQEEVKKHTKKIFKTVKNPTYSFGEKAKEITIEIFIIVFAVTLSIYLHSWSVHRHEQEQVNVFLTNLREDLVKDIEGLKRDKKKYVILNEKYTSVLNLTPSQLDSLKRAGSKVQFPLYVFGNKINNGNYEGFKTSGKIGFIENEKLKKLILAYYQTDVPDIIEADKMYALLVFKAIDSQVEYAAKTDKEKYLDPKFKERIVYLVGLGENNIEGYDKKGIKHASEILKEIDKELKE